MWGVPTVAEICSKWPQSEVGHVFPQGNWSQILGPSTGPSCADSQEGVSSDFFLPERSLVEAVGPEVETAVASCPLPLASTLALVVAKRPVFPLWDHKCRYV